jgi:hypothetical protein
MITIAHIVLGTRCNIKKNSLRDSEDCLGAGLDINVCPIPVETDFGQVDLVLRLSDGTSEKIRFPNVPVRRTNLFPLV